MKTVPKMCLIYFNLGQRWSGDCQKKMTNSKVYVDQWFTLFESVSIVV